MKKYYFIIFLILIFSRSFAKDIERDSLKITIVSTDSESKERLKVFFVKFSKNEVIPSENCEVFLKFKSKRLKFTVGCIGYKSKKIKVIAGGEIILNVYLESYKINFNNTR